MSDSDFFIGVAAATGLLLALDQIFGIDPSDAPNFLMTMGRLIVEVYL